MSRLSSFFIVVIHGGSDVTMESKRKQQQTLKQQQNNNNQSFLIVVTTVNATIITPLFLVVVVVAIGNVRLFTIVTSAVCWFVGGSSNNQWSYLSMLVERTTRTSIVVASVSVTNHKQQTTTIRFAAKQTSTSNLCQRLAGFSHPQYE